MSENQNTAVPHGGGSDALSRMYDLALVVVCGGAIALAVWLVRDILVVTFAACLVAVILNRAAQVISRFTHLPFWASLTLLVLAGTAAVVLLAVFSGPNLVEQGAQLQQALKSQWGTLHDRLAATGWGRALLDRLPKSVGGTQDGGGLAMPNGLAGSLFGAFNSGIGLLATAAVVAIAALYLAASPAIYRRGALRLVPERHRRAAKDLADAAGEALWSWSAGQAVDMLVVGLLSGLGLWLLGVPLALPLGVVAGLFNFVPYIGALMGAVPAILIAFSVSPATGAETVALYALIQGLEGNVLAPIIQKQAVDMPPAVTILAQTAFGAILGLPGLIFATPLTAALLAVFDRATSPLPPSLDMS